MHRYVFFRLFAGVLALAFTAGAHAESADAASKDATDESKPEVLVVTALRRTTDLQDTGVAATVLTGEDLIDKSVYGLTALQYAAPGITISDYGSANVFNIRGIGKSQVDIDLPGGVVIYQDGAPTITGYFNNEPYYDMGSIEVLRGPQGTYAGQSAAGGAVFINTHDPELGTTNGSVQVGAGEYAQAEFTGVANMPVGDTIAVRVAYKHVQRDDYYDSIRGPYSGNPGEQKLDAARLGVLWRPNDDTDVVFKASYGNLDFGGNPVTSYKNDLFKPFNQEVNFNYTDRSMRGVLDIKTHFDNGITLNSLTGAQHLETVNNVDANADFPAPAVFNSRGDINIYSQEFDLISPEDATVRWVLGAFWLKQQADIPDFNDHGFTFYGFGLGPCCANPVLTSPWDQQQINYAAFAHAAYNLTSSLELEGGLRYGHYDIGQSTNWLLGFGTTPPFIQLAPSQEDQALDENDLDWTIGLNWTLNNDQFLYALVSLGHVTGGINLFPVAGSFPDYESMEVVNYETGWKANWFDGQLRTQFDIYYETFDNYQAAFGVAGSPIPNSNLSAFRNASGDSEIYGAELSGQAVFGNLSFDFGVAYLDSELGTFENVVTPPILGLPPVIDLSGAKSPFSPEWTGNIGASYVFHLGHDLSLRPRIDFAYIDDTQAALWDSPRETLESRNLTNFQLNLETAKWWVQAWVTNATDEHYAGAIQNDSALFYAAPPRMYGFRAGMTF